MLRKISLSEEELFLDYVTSTAHNLWRNLVTGDHCRNAREAGAALSALLKESAQRGPKQIGIGVVLNDSALIVTLALAELSDLNAEAWANDEWREQMKREAIERVIAMYERRYEDWLGRKPA